MEVDRQTKPRIALSEAVDLRRFTAVGRSRSPTGIHRDFEMLRRGASFTDLAGPSADPHESVYGPEESVAVAAMSTLRETGGAAGDALH